METNTNEVGKDGHVGNLRGRTSGDEDEAGSPVVANPGAGDAVQIRDTFKIPEVSVAAFLKKIEKLNKVARKIGVSPVILTRGEVTFEKRAVTERDDDGETVRERTIKIISFKIEGEAPKFYGWSFLAALEPKEFGNIVRQPPGGGEISAKYQTIAVVCEHCGKKRTRKKYYLVRKETGQEKMVGSSCMKDFLGHKSPTAIATWMEMMLDLSCHEWSSGASSGPDYLDIVEVLTVAMACIRVAGFISKKMVMEKGYGTATSSEVIEFFLPPPRDREALRLWEQHREKFAPKDVDRENAAAAHQWMLDLTNKEQRSNFESNLLVFAKDRQLTAREFGSLTAGAFMAVRELDRLLIEKERQAKKSNEWVGTVGEKIASSLV